MKIAMTLTAAVLSLWSAAACADGFLVQRTERLPVLELGLGDAGYGVSQNEYELVTGKGYRLTIKSTGAKPCEFGAEEFFQNVWFRKIEINKVELRVPTVYEIEFDREGEVVLVFTPIKPGEYEWACEGLEEKGMKGSITVK